jgi:hypothetical protein
MTVMGRSLAVAACLTFCFTISSATTWYIKPDGTGDAPTIQAGIDSATTGDEIVLADGTFLGLGNRDIDFKGKSVDVRSENGNPDVCIIDCEGAGQGFLLLSGENPLIEGLTIMNGNASGEYPFDSGGDLTPWDRSI